MPNEIIFSLNGLRVFVAGHGGMVGSALMRRLRQEGCELLATPRSEVDLRRQDQVENWMKAARPEAVFVAAATVGGILANSTRITEFLYDNLMIECNLIHAAYEFGVKKLLFLGSSCIYPRLAQQPIVEEAMLSGPLEETNRWYAVAKIAGVTLCSAYRQQYGADFISVIPTNLYGPGDNFDLTQGHMVAALIAKTHRAKVEHSPEVEVWGTGKPRRDFMHVDDLADALVFLMQRYSSSEHINVGWDRDFSIAEFADMIAKVVGYGGKFRYQSDKPDGTPRKLLDVSRITTMGWRPRIGLYDGLNDAYRWYLEHVA